MKEQLQTKVNELELTLNSLELNSKNLKDDLKETNKQLADISKIKITKNTVNDIRNEIEAVLRNASFNDVSSYEVDFEIDYNNSLVLGNIEYNDQDQLAEVLSDAIENLFNIISNEDEN